MAEMNQTQRETWEKMQRAVRSGTHFIEMNLGKNGHTEVASLHPRRPGQNYYDTDEMLSRIGKPKIPHLMLERYVIHKSRNNPEHVGKLTQIRSEMDGNTKELADRYDAICADPKKLRALVGWGQHELRIKPLLNDRFYKLKVYGQKKTQFGSYYDSMFFVHLLSYESDALMKTIQENKTVSQKFENNASAVHYQQENRTEEKYVQKPDNFFRNFLIFVALTSAYNPDDQQATQEKRQDILDRWEKDGNNKEVLQEYDILPGHTNSDWRDNNSDTTTQDSLRDDNGGYYQQENNNYQQEDRTDYNQPDNNSGSYESPSPGE